MCAAVHHRVKGTVNSWQWVCSLLQLPVCSCTWVRVDGGDERWVDEGAAEVVWVR